MIPRFSQVPCLEAVDAFVPIEERIPVFLFYSTIGECWKRMKFQRFWMLLDIMKSKGGHIAGTGLLAFSRKPVGVGKMRTLQAKGPGLFIHLMDKDLLGARKELGNSQGGIIG